MKPYYQTHEPPHCPTCDCGVDPSYMEALRNDAESYRTLKNKCVWSIAVDDGNTTLTFHIPVGMSKQLLDSQDEFDELMKIIKESSKKS